MSEAFPVRKLAAILHADVVGYSRLMGEDEVTTHRVLREYLDAIAFAVNKHQGRVVNYAGDAVLADFATVTDALSCAVAVQYEIKSRNEALPQERRVQFRIGINLGEVIVDGDDIFGDGVNIAARLEGLAEPGGICLSQSARSAVGKKLPVTYHDMGEQQVKNIDEPVRAYQVFPKTTSAASTVGQISRALVKQTNTKRWLIVAVVVAVSVAIAVFSYQHLESSVIENPAQVAEALKGHPSIAVLPFTNMSDDPKQEYFVDGITEDLITDLSKLSSLLVIARHSVFTYKDTNIDVKEIAQKLDVRYVLEGSVRKVAGRIRINAQLTDTRAGRHLWAERYDGEMGDIFMLQDTVTRKIVTALAVNLTTDEKARWTRKETRSPEAYDAFLQGWRLYLLQRPDDLRRAVAYFEKAIDLDPHYTRAYAGLAATYWQSYKRLWHKSLGLQRFHDARFQAEEFLEKALQSPTPLAHQIAADMLANSRQYDKAIAEAERAIALQPNNADSYVALAAVSSLAGQADQALELIGKAMQLNPQYPPFYLYELGIAQFSLERFEQAADSLKRAAMLNPDDRGAHRLLLATYGWLGRQDDAEKVLETVSNSEQRGIQNYFDPITITTSAFWHPFKNSADAVRFAEGLRRVGLPD